MSDTLINLNVYKHNFLNRNIFKKKMQSLVASANNSKSFSKKWLLLINLPHQMLL